jgi:two-component sensor histidine kinase
MQDGQPEYSSGSYSKDALYFMGILLEFSRSLESVNSELDVYHLITSKLGKDLSLEDCVVYQVNSLEGSLYQVSAFGPKSSGKDIKNQLRLKIGEGHAGICAKEKRTMKIDDVAQSSDYIPDIISMGSEIEVPIIINGDVDAVISSESSRVNFYSEFHVKIFELIASMVAESLARIREYNELGRIKAQLESIVEQKNLDVSRLLDTLSEQYSQLKFQQEKREQLIQEIHHRVNNNLQIISSLIRLHLSYSIPENQQLLTSIHNRVQAMALIHQNVYKSVELNTVNVESYLRDLFNHIRSAHYHQITINIDLSCRVNLLSLETLVPLGILIVEFFDGLLSYYISNNTKVLDWKVDMDLLVDGSNCKLTIIDESGINIFESWSPIDESVMHGVLCQALIEQIQGQLQCEFTPPVNRIEFTFPLVSNQSTSL